MKKNLFFLVASFLLLFCSDTSFGDSICVKKSLPIKKGKVSLSSAIKSSTSASCPRGYVRLNGNFNGSQGTMGLPGTNGTNGSDGINGSNGTNGTAGADGALMAYGDGTDGDITISSATIFDPSKQYRNITVSSTGNIEVEMYSPIRCTGTLTVQGGGQIFTQAFGAGRLGNMTTSTYVPINIAPVVGASSVGASNGQVSISSEIAAGGVGGSVIISPFIDEIAKSVSLFNSRQGGGGGAGLNSFGAGGSSNLMIKCKQGIVVDLGGSITADGASIALEGAGGGAGGVIILASSTSVQIAGSVFARGGDGATPGATTAGGGGGGGGIINIISPSITTTGILNTAGGVGHTDQVAGTVTTSPRSGGGGGGACGGVGGDGASTLVDGSSTGATNGGAGIILQTLKDPLGLFIS